MSEGQRGQELSGPRPAEGEAAGSAPRRGLAEEAQHRRVEELRPLVVDGVARARDLQVWYGCEIKLPG